MKTAVSLEILPQPDEITCGPTCLHAIYKYYGDRVSLPRIIQEVKHLKTGGTLAVLLANHALERGYKARMYTYNLQAWDPTWFAQDGVDFRRKLLDQYRHKGGDRLGVLTRAAVKFLKLGGEVSMAELTPALLSRFLGEGRPILAGLSATYLYQEPREVGEEDLPDDVKGRPSGHFVVVCGYNRRTRRVLIADPLHPNPPYDSHLYEVGIYRLVGAILLGILTYDANVLILEPRKAGPRRRSLVRPGGGTGRGGGRANAGRS